MARVSVAPQEFHFVRFDAARIAELAGQVADAVGFPAGDEVVIDIDERVPLGRVRLESVDPFRLRVEGAAFEDAKRLRQLSDDAVVDTVGRWLVRALDRRSPGFAGAPAEDEVPLPVSVAWTVSCAGRCEQAGYRPSAERWRYHFRNRHAFTDVSDACFDRLWSMPSPGWDDIVAASEEATASRAPVV